MWLFGYGSLTWKVDFPYERRLEGYICGYKRMFWQSSEDHRGIPGKPGRVATLVASEDPLARVWGVAYRLPNDQAESVWSHLDFREKQGYKPAHVMFHPKESTEASFNLRIYIGTEDNPYFTGPATVQDIAKQIYYATGSSGRNIDYLLELASTVRRIAPDEEDEHLEQLDQEVKRLSSLYCQ